MITGVVNADSEAIIELLVLGPAGQRQTVEVVVDSGFNGWLSLPPSIIASLGLAWRQRGRAVLADGNESLFDIYDGKVEWIGRIRRIPIDEADAAPLAGMTLLDNHELKIEVRVGGKVTITPLT
jgi:clan AA aspartic protease